MAAAGDTIGRRRARQVNSNTIRSLRNNDNIQCYLLCTTLPPRNNINSE